MTVEIEHLSIRIGDHEVVHDVNMHVGDGERVGIIGSSGSGKSMILKAIMGLLPQQAEASGSIMVAGEQVIGASDDRLADMRGRVMSMVAQDPSASLNPVTSIVQQVMLPLKLHYDLDKKELHDRALAALHSVGLGKELADSFPHRLSGGQQQRAAIATALVTSPSLILADEPTTALDSVTQRAVVDVLTKLVDDAGTSMVFVTHDFAVLSRVANRCYVMHEGRVIEEGETLQLLERPQESVTRELVQAAVHLSLHIDVDAASNEEHE